MSQTTTTTELSTIRKHLHPLSGRQDDYDPLLERIGDARIVLLGEATHGTREFYHERARITKRLIEEKGFTTIAVEADWPDAYRINRFVRGMGTDTSPHQALGDFRRFPLWMWRNTEIEALVGWLLEHNRSLGPGGTPVGFYGLDLYSLFASIQAVLEYLDVADPEAAKRARQRYACFDHFGEDSQSYGYASSLGLSASCEKEAVGQLLDLQRRAAELASRDGRIPEDEFFFAAQNARLVKNAEEYYRMMFGSRVSTWNLRDQHMTETLETLVEHFGSQGVDTKVVVWEHNSHLGDARATQMGASGEWNVGQLVRERFADDAVLVGFSTHSGTVTAARNWDEPAQRRTVRPGLPGSFEELFHEVGVPSFLLPLKIPDVADALKEPRLQRAIGVIYRPETERGSHYFFTHLPNQFDAMIHIDQTHALQPLDRSARWDAGEAPDTYPFEL